MKTMSLRKFRAEIASLHEVVDVARRDAEGNLQVLGYWTPYMQDAPVEIIDLGPNATPEDAALTRERWERAQKLQSKIIAGTFHPDSDPDSDPIDVTRATDDYIQRVPRSSFGAPRPAPKTTRKK